MKEFVDDRLRLWVVGLALMGKVEFARGQPSPVPVHGECMRIAMSPTEGDNGLDVLFLIAGRHFAEEELRQFLTGALRVGILPFPPIVFLLMLFKTAKYDAPYAVGLYPPAQVARLRACAEEPRAWGSNIRRPVNIVFIEETTQVIAGLRTATLTQAWWAKLADAFAACPSTLSVADHRLAMAQAYRRWPSFEAMIAACSAVEHPGI